VDEARDLVRHMKGRAGHDSDSFCSSRAERTGQGVPGSAGSGWSAGRTGEAHTELMTVGWADDGQQYGLNWTLDGQQQQRLIDLGRGGRGVGRGLLD
jgi:hypothetical protein